MPMSAFQQPVRSDSVTQFIEALATNEATANVDLPLSLRSPLWFIRAIQLTAVQNLAYELMFFSSATNFGGTIPTSKYIGGWQFAEMSGSVPASPGYPVVPVDSSPSDPYYNFYIDGLQIPYWDEDLMNASQAAGTFPACAQVHCRLVNRSTTAKNPTTTGAVQVTLFIAPQGQQV